MVYHELAQLNLAFPHHSALVKVSKNLNAECQIQPTPGQTVGMQQSIVERFRMRLKNNLSFALRKSIRAKITGDGTVVSRISHLLVIAFSLLHEDKHPNSPNGNHTNALLQTTENYDKCQKHL